MTILISSHLLSEVEKVASHIGIIYKGKMLFQGSLSELKSFQQKGSRLLINTSDNETASKLLQEYQPEREEGMIAIPLQDQKQVATIQKKLFLNNLDVYLLQPKANDLEHLFIDLIDTHS